MRALVPALLCALCAVSNLPAQDEGDGEGRPARGRLAWFIPTSIPEDLDNPVRIMTGTTLSEVLLSRRSTGGPVKVPADGIIRMVRQVENPEAPGEMTYETLAEARIPEGMQKAAIILVAAGEDKAPLVYQTKVQDLAKFTGGDYMFLNLTTANIMVRMGETKLGLKPGSTQIYDGPRQGEAVNTPISYHYFHPTKEEWKLLSASTVVLRPTRREICIFSWNPRYKRVSYHGITFPVTP